MRFVSWRDPALKLKVETCCSAHCAAHSVRNPTKLRYWRWLSVSAPGSMLQSRLAVRSGIQTSPIGTYNSKFPRFPTYLVAFGAAHSDMAGILIIAHAPFASALRECITHIYGGLPARIGVIDVMPDCDPVEVRRVCAFRNRPSEGRKRRDRPHRRVRRHACEYRAEPGQRRAFACLPASICRCSCARSAIATTPLDTLAEKSLQGGSKGIQELDASTPVNPCAMASAAAAAAAAVASCAADAAATSCMPAKVASH